MIRRRRSRSEETIENKIAPRYSPSTGAKSTKPRIVLPSRRERNNCFMEIVPQCRDAFPRLSILSCESLDFFHDIFDSNECGGTTSFDTHTFRMLSKQWKVPIQVVRLSLNERLVFFCFSLIRLTVRVVNYRFAKETIRTFLRRAARSSNPGNPLRRVVV